MKVTTFKAVYPYEIGDKVVVLEAVGKNEKGVIYTERKGTITDIVCMHYIKTGRVIVLYEINNSGQYEHIMTLAKTAIQEK